MEISIKDLLVHAIVILPIAIALVFFIISYTKQRRQKDLIQSIHKVDEARRIAEYIIRALKVPLYNRRFTVIADPQEVHRVGIKFDRFAYPGRLGDEPTLELRFFWRWESDGHLKRETEDSIPTKSLLPLLNSSQSTLTASDYNDILRLIKKHKWI